MKLIILDRDGVLNEESPDYIKTPEELVPIPTSLEAVSRLNAAGYRVTVATNQSAIGRGIIDMAMLNSIHQKMHNSLSRYGGWVDAIFFCPDTPDTESSHRKPKPGMLLDIAERCHTDLATVQSVGDRLTDIQAAQAAGAQPILVRTGHGKRTEMSGDVPDDVPVYDDLAAFVDALLVQDTHEDKPD